MFAGFTLTEIDAGAVRLRVRHGGSGPPVVLLHGHPRTHATWHRVAPRLAAQHTVICPDLRGYGGSSKPPSDPEHTVYSKRAMAADVVGLLDALGHRRAAVVGHDRGAYVAMRTALDHPDRVSRLGVLDGVPIGEALARCDARFAARWWHWFFLGQLAKPAERVINADPDAWYGGSPEEMGEQAYADYRRAIHDPATVHAMCEDYRAGLGPDRAADDADRAAGRRIGCPVLFAWSERDDMVDLYGDPAAIWRDWADDVRTASIPSGHHMAEEAPRELTDVLAGFLAEDLASVSDRRG
ncbi:alpha/beta hydrolase [Micromonospora chalcea]|uniref:alpha/beta fold hydrolase n=1 Tax=Micromonospora chalcea TaxID=1874 RepID=UPI001657181A|nr:alpha/beta hydrolase [Micromonospora chalcea]MBC8991993.1 alpha/beta hydrolase [Micromonospora chalcea]